MCFDVENDSCRPYGVITLGCSGSVASLLLRPKVRDQNLEKPIFGEAASCYYSTGAGDVADSRELSSAGVQRAQCSGNATLLTKGADCRRAPNRSKEALNRVNGKRESRVHKTAGGQISTVIRVGAASVDHPNGRAREDVPWRPVVY